jgi:hypothetical protein
VFARKLWPKRIHKTDPKDGANVSDGSDDEDDYNEEIGEEFVDALAENYYYDYENQVTWP